MVSPVCGAPLMSNEQFGVWVLPYNFQSFLIYDSSAIGTHIQVVPITSNIWRHFITIFIARIKTATCGCILANANPSVLPTGLVRNIFLWFFHDV